MAETPKNIEDVAKNAPQQNAESKEEHKEEAKDHAKEEKPKGTLENVVNETFHLAGNAVKLGLAAAIPATPAIF